MIGELRRGKEGISQQAEGTSAKGRYTPFISWKPEETKVVFFLTPIAEVPQTLMHNFVRKFVEDSEGFKQERWLTFMCRKDPAWLGESGGECPLCDEIGHTAQERFVSLAVELEPVLEGKKVTGLNVKYRTGTDSDGNEVQYPQVGLVMQGSRNFFHTLVALDQTKDVDDISWEITREGEKLNTRYIFYPIELKPDLSEITDYVPQITDVLESLGSAERYEKELAGVTSADQVSYDREKKEVKRTGRTQSNNGSDDVFSKMKEDLRTKSGAKLEKY